MTLSRHAKSRPKFTPTDIDGNQIHNEILLRLPPNERKPLFSMLEFVPFKTHHVLHEARKSIRSVYFINSGLASVVSVLTDGRSVEVGLIGKEGFVGLAVLAGFRKSFTRVIAQAEITAFRLDADVLTCGVLRPTACLSSAESTIGAPFADSDGRGEPACGLQPPSSSEPAPGEVAAHEPGPNELQVTAINPRVPGADVGYPPVKREHCRRRLARCRNH